MASLDTPVSAATAAAASTDSNRRGIAFRVTGDVSNFKSGMTSPKKAGAKPQPYVSFRIKGTTPTGKSIDRTVMGFGPKAIENLDVQANTKRAGIFVTFDRRGKNSNILVPVGPYRAD